MQGNVTRSRNRITDLKQGRFHTGPSRQDERRTPARSWAAHPSHNIVRTLDFASDDGRTEEILETARLVGFPGGQGSLIAYES